MKTSALRNTKAGSPVEATDKYFMRPDEAAQFLGISKRSLSNAQRRHAIAYSKLGRIVIFSKSDLIAAVEKFRVKSGGEV